MRLVIPSLFSFIFLACSCSAQTAIKMNTQSIVFIGASESSGYGLADGASHVHKFSKLLEKDNLHFEVKNTSYPGASTKDGISMFQSILNSNDSIHTVFISLGLSDVVYGDSPDQIYQNLFKLTQFIRGENSKVVIYIMEGEIFQYHALPNLPKHDSDYYKQYKNIYVKLRQNADVIIYPFLMKSFNNQPEHFLSDMVHPNNIGTTEMAKLVYEYFTAVDKGQ